MNKTELIAAVAEKSALSKKDAEKAVNAMVADRDRARKFGEAGRARAVEEFSWATIAQQTVDVYKSVL